MKNQIIWEAGKQGELAFWRGWLAGKKDFCERAYPLTKRLDFMIGDKKEVLIANLGTGPVCLIGNVRDGMKVEVISSDLLADEYQKIFKEMGITPRFPSEKQDMTDLTYKNNTFDIVYCTNALDHSQNPYKALKEMVRVTKPGGWIYLRHVAHVGKRQGYHNMHQWNLDITSDNDCIIWNKADFETETFLLSDIYKGFTTNITVGLHSSYVTSFVQKK